MSDEGETRGTSGAAGSRTIMLTFQNFAVWFAYLVNRCKGLKSPDLVSFLVTKTSPTFILPIHSMKLGGEFVYSQDDMGKDDCGHDRKCVRTRKSRFEELLPKLISIIYDTIDDGVLDKMKIDTDFDGAYADNDLLKIVEMAQLYSMGEGSSTTYQTLALLLKHRLVGNDVTGYFRKFQEMRKRILDQPDPDLLLGKVFDTVLIVGLKDHKPLEKQIDAIFGMKDWPTADRCILEFSTLLTVKRTMSQDKETKAGMVDANRANLNDEEEGGPTSLWGKQGSGRRVRVCFRCGKEADHVAAKCPLTKKHGPAVCKFCHGNHCSSIHKSHFPDQKMPDAEDNDEAEGVKKVKKTTAQGRKAAVNKATVKEERAVAKANSAKVAKASRKARRAQEIDEDDLSDTSNSSDGELVSVRSTYARVNNNDSYYSRLTDTARGYYACLNDATDEGASDRPYRFSD